MASANLTRLALTLGSRNSVTGWREKTYIETTIRGSIQPRGSTKFISLPGGMATYEHTGYFPDVVHEGDLIKDQQEQYYEVRTVPQQWWLDKFDGYYPCEMVKLANYPETAISPPTPDEEDARYRTRVWLRLHLSLSCDWWKIYAFPNYPLQYEFTGDNVEGNDAEKVLYCIGQPQSTPLFTYDHHIYAFREQVPITIAILGQFSQDNNEKVLWAAEDALRKVCREYPQGSVRTLDVIRDKTERHGSATILMRECILNYKRSAEYLPTTPALTWGDSEGPLIYPNAMRVEYSGSVPDAKFLPPGRIGNLKQILGDTSLTIRISCDLDVAPWPTLTWKRTGMGDPARWWFVLDMKHNGAIDEPYQTLTLDWGEFKVRLVDFNVRLEGESNVLDVTFEEYNPDSAMGTVKDRYGAS